MGSSGGSLYPPSAGLNARAGELICGNFRAICLMSGDVMPELAGWDSFYVIIGSSAAALTGLMFVVIAVSGEVAPAQDTVAGIRAFSTPTVVHFGAVLLLA